MGSPPPMHGLGVTAVPPTPRGSGRFWVDPALTVTLPAVGASRTRSVACGDLPARWAQEPVTRPGRNWNDSPSTASRYGSVGQPAASSCSPLLFHRSVTSRSDIMVAVTPEPPTHSSSQVASSPTCSVGWRPRTEFTASAEAWMPSERCRTEAGRVAVILGQEAATEHSARSARPSRWNAGRGLGYVALTLLGLAATAWLDSCWPRLAVRAHPLGTGSIPRRQRGDRGTSGDGGQPPPATRWGLRWPQGCRCPERRRLRYGVWGWRVRIPARRSYLTGLANGPQHRLQSCAGFVLGSPERLAARAALALGAGRGGERRGVRTGEALTRYRMAWDTGRRNRSAYRLWPGPGTLIRSTARVLVRGGGAG